MTHKTQPKFKVGDFAKVKNSSIQSVHIIQVISETDSNGTIHSYYARPYMGTSNKYLSQNHSLFKIYEMELGTNNKKGN